MRLQTYPTIALTHNNFAVLAMVLGFAPCGELTRIAHVVSFSDCFTMLNLGKFVLVSYGTITFMLLVHCLILRGHSRGPAYVPQKGVFRTQLSSFSNSRCTPCSALVAMTFVAICLMAERALPMAQLMPAMRSIS